VPHLPRRYSDNPTEGPNLVYSDTTTKIETQHKGKKVDAAHLLSYQFLRNFLSIMDFSSFNVGGIDFSPAPWITRTTLVLEEPELRNATQEQFERFWRVWHSERSEYAPCLVELTLVLRAGYNDGTMELRGINAFLEYYSTNIESYATTKGLHIYLDSVSANIGHVQHTVMDAPLMLFTIAAEPQYAPKAWPRLPTSYLLST